MLNTVKMRGPKTLANTVKMRGPKTLANTVKMRGPKTLAKYTENARVSADHEKER